MNSNGRIRTGMVRIFRSLFLPAALSLLVALAGCSGGGGSSGSAATGEETSKAITSFSFLASRNSSAALTKNVQGIIDESDHRIMLYLPVYTYDTSMNFVASFQTTGPSVSVNGVVQKSGSTLNDFSSGILTYRVTAWDGSHQDYTVVIETIDYPRSFTSFRFLAEDNGEAGLASDVIGSIDETSRTIVLTVPEEADVTKLVPSFTSSEKAPEEAGIQIFADCYSYVPALEDPVYFENAHVVSGESGIDFSRPLNFRVSTGYFIKDYTVMVEKRSSAKTFTSFRLMAADNGVASLKHDILGIIDARHHRIILPIPSDIDVTKLTPCFSTTGTGVLVNGATQASGTTTNDFSNPVTYQVSALDGSMSGYLVSVVRRPSPESNPIHPYVAMDDGGNALVICQGQGLCSTEYRDGKWGSPFTVIPWEASYSNIKISSDGRGNAIATWEQMDPGNDTWQIIRREYRGGEWKAPAAVCPPRWWVRNTAVSMDGFGNAAVIWEQANQDSGNTSTTCMSEYRDGAWEAPVPFALAGSSPLYSNGRFADVRLSDSKLLLSEYHDGAWDATRTISSDAGYSTSFDSAMDKDGNLILVWTQRWDDGVSGMSRDCVFRCELKHGVLGAPVPISRPYCDAQYPIIALDNNGNAIIAWAQYDHPTAKWEVCRSERREGAWTDPEVAGYVLMNPGSNPDSNPLITQIAVNDAGDAVLIWNDKRRIYSSKKTNGTWSASALVTFAYAPIESYGSNSAFHMGGPVVALGGQGTSCIVWSQLFNGFDMAVMSSLE